MGCEVDRFKEIIEKEKEHLKYLEQLAKTHKVTAALSSLFTPLLEKCLPRGARQSISSLVGLPTPFEAIQGIVQLVAVAKPEVMVTVIERALERAQSAVESKQKDVKKVELKLKRLTEKLSGEWGFLLDFSAGQSVSFNEMYNRKMPEYLSILEALKVKMLKVEYDMHVGDRETLEDDMKELKELFKELREIAVHPGIDPFQEFLFDWLDIRGILNGILGFDIQAVKDDVGMKTKNFVDFTGSLGVVVQEFGRMLLDIQTLQDEAEKTWEKIHGAFFKTISDQKELYEPVFQAIKLFLETGERQDIDFGGTITKETMEKWFTETNTSHQLAWYSKAKEMIDAFSVIRVNEMNDGVNSVCGPIIELLLQGFDPDAWTTLENNTFFIETCTHQMMRGLPITVVLEDSVEAVKGALESVSETLNNVVEFFKENKPAQKLSEIFETNMDDRKVIKAIVFAADKSGFDFLSKMVNEGNLLVAMGLKESTSKTVQQLLACLEKAIEDGPATHQKVALEIQKVVNAEVIRQKKLDRLFSDAIKKDVQEQLTRIDKYEHMLAEYGGA